MFIHKEKTISTENYVKMRCWYVCMRYGVHWCAVVKRKAPKISPLLCHSKLAFGWAVISCCKFSNAIVKW